MPNTQNTHRKATSSGNRTRLLMVVLCVGLIGLGTIIFLIRKGSDQAIGAVSSYAGRGAFTNLSEIFQIPVLMFFGVLVAYSISELYKTYRAMNDPETYRRKSVASTRYQSRRKDNGLTNRQKNREAKRAMGELPDLSKVRPIAGLSARSTKKSSGVSRRRRTPLH